MGQAPPVDFCNQTNPRAQPPNRSSPSRRPGGCPPVTPSSRDEPRRTFAGWCRSLPHPTQPESMRWTGIDEQLQPRCHGSEAGPACAARRLSRRLLAAKALPQPDRLGHPMSRTRDGSGWKPLPPGAHTGWTPFTSSPGKPAFAEPATTPFIGLLCRVSARADDPLTPDRPTCRTRSRDVGQRRWAACTDTIQGRGPPHALLREEARDPPHPRCLPSMSYPAGVGDCPQLANKLWTTIGAFAIVALPAALDGATGRDDSVLSRGGRLTPAFIKGRPQRPHRLLRSRRSAA